MILDWFIYYFSILILLIIGCIISLDDFYFGKIRNKWIKAGCEIGLVYYTFLLVLNLLAYFELVPVYYGWQYFGLLFLNTIIAFVLAFTLWNFKLWAGGDAKLFILYVFLIPLSFYQNAYLPVFPAINLLINIIIPIFIYLLIKILIYPISLAVNYLKNPKLFKEYLQKHKQQNKFDKAKIKEHLNTGLSFLLILIFFQILRTRVNEFLNPHLGSLVHASYFFMGFVIFKPLRAFLKTKLIIVLIAVLAYFIFGFIYFREQVYTELHMLFALQIIFMMSYFYIFKYGRTLGQFLYNSAEVKMIPVEELRAGTYINKSYIKKIMGTRTNLDDFKKGVEAVLDEEESKAFLNLLEEKTSKTGNEKQQYKLISVFRNLRPESAFRIVSQIFEYKNQKNLEKNLLAKVNSKLDDKQKSELDNILNKTDDISKFLKTIKGKLTEEQSAELKKIIKIRNEEVKAQGLEPVENIILHKTFSFAPFMLLGVLITLLTKSSIIHLVYEYILHR